MATSSVLRESWNRHGLSFLDSRIKRCIAIAPAPPVRAFLTDSLSDIDYPTMIIAGEADIEAPFEHCAAWLKNQNNKFHLRSLGEHVGHYVFIAECTELGRELEPEICIDLPGVNRAKIHDEVAAIVHEFLASH